MTIVCPKCGQSNSDSVRFCTRCHFPLRIVCPACAHVQGQGGVCEACGIDFVQYGMAQLAKVKLESEGETARMKKRSGIFREVVLAVASGGFSLLKYLRPRR